MFGQPIKVETTSGGHYCNSLLPEFRDSHYDCNQHLQKSDVVLLLDSQGNEKDCKKELIKLHKQFGHASYEHLKSLLKNAGVSDQNTSEMLEHICKECNTCLLFKKPPPCPAAGLPFTSDFNETVAMDLHELGQNV